MSLTIGCHLSIAKGYAQMVDDAVSIGANTFAFFTRNPRGGGIKPVDADDMEACRRLLEANGFGRLVAHAPYVLNPCAAREDLRRYAVDTMIEDLGRMACLPGSCYNFHPGSHVGQGGDVGISLTAQFLDAVLPHAGNTTVLIETMSGKGSEIGRTFGEVADIISQVTVDTSNLGVCLDTCHIWDAGYDIASSLDDVLAGFDSTIGLGRLHAIHLNDSMNPLGSHKDRHACIGAGCIGFDALARVANHPALRGLPFILETPHKQLGGYADEIRMLRLSASTEGPSV